MTYDVIVIGGGAAGVGAAIGAAQAGATTLLVESGPCLGGAATQKNVLTYCGLYTQSDPPRLAVGGVALQVMRELSGLGGAIGPVRLDSPGHHVIATIDPEAVKLALDRTVGRVPVEVLTHTLLTSVTRSGDLIESLTLHDHRGPRQIYATAFVDASGEGDLAAFGGALVRYGNHDQAQAGTLGVRYGGISPEITISTQQWIAAIKEAKKHGDVLVNKENGLLLRIPLSGDLITYSIDATYNALDGASISEAERTGRERAWAYLRALRTIPGCEAAYIVSTGPNFGTRESRHINAQYQVTATDVATGARQPDVIALGAWPSEIHFADGSVQWQPIRNNGTFDIPIRSIRSVNTSNLFAAGRLIDGDAGGGGAMRVMGTSFGTGQAAGVAAARPELDASNVKTIQDELIRQGAYLNADQLALA